MSPDLSTQGQKCGDSDPGRGTANAKAGVLGPRRGQCGGNPEVTGLDHTEPAVQ